MQYGSIVLILHTYNKQHESAALLVIVRVFYILSTSRGLCSLQEIIVELSPVFALGRVLAIATTHAGTVNSRSTVLNFISSVEGRLGSFTHQLFNYHKFLYLFKI